MVRREGGHLGATGSGMRLSYTSKMPCPSFALPAGKECPTGAKLINVEGSSCRICYARKGFYLYKEPKLLRRTNLHETKQALHSKSHRKYWVERLTALIIADGTAWFRWHDSGDLLAPEHLQMIMDVCERTPDVKHWLPTREYVFVEKVLQTRPCPKNLTIRLSAHMVGQVLTHALPTSSIGTQTGKRCPATYDPAHDGACQDCRACWSAQVPRVDYKRH